MRLGYIIGYENGVSLGDHFALRLFVRQQTEAFYTDAARMVEKDLLPVGMTRDETISAVNRFFEDPLNLRIEIYEAIQITSMEAGGETKTSIDERIRQVRARVAGETK